MVATVMVVMVVRTGQDGTGPDGTGPDGTGPDGTGRDGTGQTFKLDFPGKL